jgi:hypothetical protein
MKVALFLLVFATTALAQLPEETPTPPIDPKVNFNVSIIGTRREFHIGEIIPLKLAYSSRAKKRYQLNDANYDRSGRMEYERFIVTPSDGAVDPLAEYFATGLHVGGGMQGAVFLKPKPWTIDLDLNEWVRFTKGGEYKLRVAARRVEIVDSSRPRGTVPVTALSNEVTLRILPRDPEWEKRTYYQAVATLKNPSSDKRDKTWKSPALRALETLRFLGTPDATRELANQLRADDPRRGDFDCYIGLVTSPERKVARQALEEALADPERPISDTLLDALIWLESHGEKRDPNSAEGERKVLEKALDALAHKRGEFLRVSLYSLLYRNWVRGEEDLLNRDIVEKLVSQLLETWDQLPVRQQTDLLEGVWQTIKTPAILPVLKRAAQDKEADLAGIAIRRWFELDPDGARSAIISEISRPKPRLGVRRLGILPDQTLPEVEQPLVDHLRGEEDSESGANIAALIARYAGAAILPQVLKTLDAQIGKCRGDVQAPLLAYILRVDPESARPRIEKAVVAGRKNVIGWNRDVLRDIAVIHYDPLLETIAVRALDDPDDEVAGNAAALLGGYGSAATESALWRRYEKWCKRWAGRELQVNLQSVDALRLDEGGRDDVSIGRSFVRAIAEGDGWLADEARLQRLKAMSKVPTIQADIDRYLEQWHRSLLTLMISSCGPTSSAQTPDVADINRFSARVAQYGLDSRDELMEKLSQFPRGTKFEFWRPSDKADQACIDDLRAFIASHEFSVTDGKVDEGN